MKATLSAPPDFANNGLLIQEKERIQWLDAIKGAAILLVIMSHSQTVPYLHGLLVACYMQLFYIAAGYTYTATSWHALLTKRCKRLLTPYIVWSLFFFLLYITKSMFTGTLNITNVCIKAGGILYSRYAYFPIPEENNIFFFVKGSEPLWFLTSMTLSFIIAFPLFKAKGRVLATLISLYFVISAAFMYCPILMPCSLDTAFIGAIFIFCGSKLRHIVSNYKASWLLLILCTLIYAGLTFINRDINMSVRNYGSFEYPIVRLTLFFIIGIVGTTAYSLFFMLLNNSFICAFFAYIGRMSLTIMCAHSLFIMLFAVILNKIQSVIGAIHPWLVVFPLRLLFIVTCCIFLDKLIKLVQNMWLKHRIKSMA